LKINVNSLILAVYSLTQATLAQMAAEATAANIELLPTSQEIGPLMQINGNLLKIIKSNKIFPTDVVA